MSHLEDYLSYYKDLQAPGYAVLVTGAWGIGKTFQVTHSLSESESLYVSLYGLQSVDQIHARVFAAAFPKKAKTQKALSFLQGKQLGAAGISIPLGLIPDVAKAYLIGELEPDKILILDDLERCSIDTETVLGAINTYIEHKDFRVVVIAHDDEKLLGEEFRTIKEKIFGQTIQVEPHIGKAFDSFSDSIEAVEAKAFVKNHKSEINSVFLSSGVKSLRVLRFAIEDLVRLHGILSVKHLKNARAMAEIVKLLSAFELEFRSGGLKEDDLKNRAHLGLTYRLRGSRERNETDRVPALVIANNKFPDIDLESEILNDAVLVSILVEGRFSKAEICASIDNYPHFIVPADVPPWKVVINFDELASEVVEDAAKRMKQQFDNLEVTDSGEMLHVFSLRMMMAENGIIDKSVEDVVKENIAYIDHLLEEGRLPPREPDWQWFQSFRNGHDGYGYWVTDHNRDHFNRIWGHLLSSRESAFEAKIPEIVNVMLDLVARDPNAFFEAVSPTNNGPNPYAIVPLLHELEPCAFVDAWLSSEHKNWRYVQHALEGRYKANRLNDELAPEKGWAMEVLKELNRRSDAEQGFSALRIKRIRPKVLIQLMQEEEQIEGEDVDTSA
ncbi:hypothetical protein [uncultured Cohaesibacter sp.]|uniref:hypothetical protein n=1 Tax=uncultured Cohaesibacter sp. TaxID=1002546 RepID=UPI002AA82681|nr:hypothetical protein [uncultured Cohaesibacter sp.]